MTINPAAKETQVREQLGRLDVVVDQLVRQIEGLEDRLHVVLRGEDEGKSEDRPTETLVPLAEEVMSYADRVAYAVGRIIRLVERCEL